MGSYVEKTSHYNDWPNAQGFDVRYEERSPTELEVLGNIPAYASGVLFRTSLGPREVKSDKGTTFRVNHWFDNLAQIHRFQIHEPDASHSKVRVTHNSRSTCDGLIEKIKKTGDLAGLSFGAKYDPCMSFFQKLQATFIPSRGGGEKLAPDDFSIAVTLSPNFPGLSRTGEEATGGHDKSRIGTLCTKTDADLFQMLDPETLEPIGIANQGVLHPMLKGPSSATHAKSDPVTGDVFNYNLEFGRTGIYRVFTVSAATGKTSILATISHSGAYLHSLFLTEHYVVLCVWNSFYAVGGLKILWKKNIVEAISDYDGSRPATWFVVDRKPVEEGGKGLVATYQSDPFYCFHTINAYEESSSSNSESIDLVMDLVAYENLDCLKRFYIDNLTSDSESAKAFCDPDNRSTHGFLRRFRLPNLPTTPQKNTLKAISEFTDSGKTFFELPTLSPLKFTRKHRYVYGVMDTGRSTFWDGLIKYDVDTHTYVEWSVHGQSAGEPIFVPDPNSEDEDGGVLLSVVMDGIQGYSYLLCLDAKTMKEVGRANVRNVVGFGFHGTFVQNKATAAEGGLHY